MNAETERNDSLSVVVASAESETKREREKEETVNRAWFLTTSHGQIDFLKLNSFQKVSRI